MQQKEQVQQQQTSQERTVPEQETMQIIAMGNEIFLYHPRNVAGG
jgi:hypothetical protein